jgi:hypothetical protein
MTKQSQGADARIERNLSNLCEVAEEHNPYCRQAGHLKRTRRRATPRLLATPFEDQSAGGNEAPWLLLIAIADRTWE